MGFGNTHSKCDRSQEPGRKRAREDGRLWKYLFFFVQMVKPESIYRLKKEQNRNSLQIEGKYRENDGSRNRDSRRWGPTWGRDSSACSESMAPSGNLPHGGACTPGWASLPFLCGLSRVAWPSSCSRAFPWQRVEPDMEVGRMRLAEARDQYNCLVKSLD